MKYILSLLLLFVLFINGASAKTPEELSKEYFDLLVTQDWNKIGALYDPAALSDFKDMMSFLGEIPDDAAGPVLGQFFGPGTTSEDVAGMSDVAFFTGFMRGVMVQAAAVGQLNFENIDILGTLEEGENLNHVVIRTRVGIGEMSLEAMEVITFSNASGEWKIVLQGKIKGMAKQMKAAMGM
ncbi:MAG: hypothetical protein ACPGN3_17950 [Opitutales bacterium]